MLSKIKKKDKKKKTAHKHVSKKNIEVLTYNQHLQK